MSNTYHISIEQLRINGLKEMFSALERGFNRFSIDFYIVGAFARDIWFTMHQIKEKRATKDIDLAIWITEEKQFFDLKIYLVEQEGFIETRANPFTLVYKNNIQIDLLPFGSIEQQDHTVRFDGLGLTTISTQGLEEVYRASQQIELGQEKAFKISSLPGLVILKLLAWEDRQEIRPKDAKDIFYILESYFKISENEIFEHHNDLFEETAELAQIAAQVLGRQMQEILSNNLHLRERVINLLTRQTENSYNSSLGEAMIIGSSSLVTDAVDLLKMMLRGIRETK